MSAAAWNTHICPSFTANTFILVFFSVHWDFTSSVHLHASQNGRKHHAMRPFLFLWSLQNSGQWRKDRLLNILKIICCQAAIMAHRWPGPVKQVWLISLSGLAQINNSSVSAEWMNKCLIKIFYTWHKLNQMLLWQMWLHLTDEIKMLLITNSTGSLRCRKVISFKGMTQVFKEILRSMVWRLRYYQCVIRV